MLMTPTKKCLEKTRGNMDKILQNIFSCALLFALVTTCSGILYFSSYPKQVTKIIASHVYSIPQKISTASKRLFAANAWKSLKSFKINLGSTDTSVKSPNTIKPKSNNNNNSAGFFNINAAKSTVSEYVMVYSTDTTTFSSETMATVASMPYKEGLGFSAGDTLISFDCRLPEADLQRALAQQEAANNAYKSAEKLKSYHSISDYEFMKASAELDVAKADAQRYSTLVDKCTIKAPYTGAVAASMVHVGETVKPGDPLLRIVNTSNLELQIEVPSDWLAWLHVGVSFNVTINEIKKTFHAKVDRISPEIHSVSQTVKIIGRIATPELGLLPGMSGQAIFAKPAPTNGGR